MLAVALITLVLPSAADAQSTSDAIVERTNQQRESADTRLRSSRETLEQTRARERQVRSSLQLAEAERADLNAQLIDMARRVQSGETRLSEIEDRLAELGEQRQLITGSLVRQQRTIAELLAALQRMGRNPPPVMMTKRRDALEMVRSAMLLSTVFPELRDKAVALNDRLQDLDRVATEIKTQGKRLREQNTLLAQAEDRLDDLLHTKDVAVRQTQQELDEIRRVAESQARNVRNLGDLIDELDKTVEKYTKLGEYERELARRERAEAARRADALKRKQQETDIALLPPTNPVPETARPADETPAPAPPGRRPERTAPPADAPAARRRTLPDATTETQVARGRTRRANPGRLKPSIPFARAKGRLVRPASGRRIFSFGGKTRVGSGPAKGIAVETRARAQVTSPNDGWIVYAGPFRSYGQLLIINAGGGYHVLLAGMERINVRIGQFVLAGEPVGKMRAATPKAGARAKSDAPILYIEFRYKGRPINPDPWWATRSG
ncbi:MAG: peptidoglycan DD-metalloendopeptidase family protein [Pseudomonadota bacterium]